MELVISGRPQSPSCPLVLPMQRFFWYLEASLLCDPCLALILFWIDYIDAFLKFYYIEHTHTHNPFTPSQFELCFIFPVCLYVFCKKVNCWSLRDSMVGKANVLHVPKLSSIPGIPYVQGRSQSAEPGVTPGTSNPLPKSYKFNITTCIWVPDRLPRCVELISLNLYFPTYTVNKSIWLIELNTCIHVHKEPDSQKVLNQGVFLRLTWVSPQTPNQALLLKENFYFLGLYCLPSTHRAIRDGKGRLKLKRSVPLKNSHSS